jgi:hypothetical protein
MDLRDHRPEDQDWMGREDQPMARNHHKEPRMAQVEKDQKETLTEEQKQKKLT